MGWIKPLDFEKLATIFANHSTIVTAEEGTLNGGLGSIINSFATQNNYKNTIINRGVADAFIEHGTVKQLFELTHLDTLSLTQLFIEINHD